MAENKGGRRVTRILKEGVIKEGKVIGVKCDFCDTEFETDEYNFIDSKYVYPHSTLQRFHVSCPFCNRQNIIIFRNGEQTSNEIPK